MLPIVLLAAYAHWWPLLPMHGDDISLPEAFARCSNGQRRNTLLARFAIERFPLYAGSLASMRDRDEYIDGVSRRLKLEHISMRAVSARVSWIHARWENRISVAIAHAHAMLLPLAWPVKMILVLWRKVNIASLSVFIVLQQQREMLVKFIYA